MLNEVVGGARPLDQPLEVPPGQLHHEGGERGQRLYSKSTHLKRSADKVSFGPTSLTPPHPQPHHTHTSREKLKFYPKQKMLTLHFRLFQSIIP